MNLDLFLFQQLNQFAGKWLWLDKLAIFFAKYLEYFLILLLVLFLARNFKKFWLIFVKAFVSAILARFIIVNIIRWFLPRPRPFVENHVNLLIPYNVAEYSFPSGHAAFYFALSTIVYSYNKKAGILFFISSFLIAISRVFVGIHWPFDIISGALVGIFSGWLVLKIFRK